MKVLLVSANTETINMPVLPLGLSCIARATREAGHEIRVINTMDAGRLIPDTAAAIGEFAPDVIAVSVRNIDDQVMEGTRFMLEPVKDLIAACRDLTCVPVIIGGAGYSIFPVAALDYLGADMGIHGPGEKPFVQLLERLEKGAPPAEIPGLYLPEGGCAASSAPSGDINFSADINAFPPPGPEDQLFAALPPEHDTLWIPFQTRRGCAMHCSYCSTAAIEGTTARKRDLDQVIDVLADYEKAGHDHFFFVDNTFNLPPAYAESLCDRLVDADLNLSWRTIVYPWKLDDTLAGKMAAAGCKEISLGFESGSPVILKALNKKFTPDDVRQVAAALKRQNIQQTGFLLLGGPGETPDTIRQSLAFADSLDLDVMKITCGIRIYPRTQLARQAVADGIVAPGDDLLFPRFYLAPAVRDCIHEIVAPWMADRSHWF
ncbi:MAG: radical SAM protein [Thermodesulfobacteriota bacterium]|nr:radical SAM protein [Thermodesulfobacteriota bacterium]